MTRGRLEAFSDGVLAIIITILVLELETPRGTDWAALRPLVPVFLAYVLSFVYIGIYWNNHHHMLHVADCIDGRVLWPNLLLLFWLSLIPFVTAWMGENRFAPVPTAAYGVVLLMAALAWLVLQGTLLRIQGPNSRLATAIGNDVKGKLSAAMYAVAIPLAFVREWMAHALYVLVALMWLVPDKRMEATFDR